MSFITKALISGLLIALVSELAPRLPRLGALIISLPLVSVAAFLMLWWQEKSLVLIAQIARETLVLVPLSLAFFVPLAFSNQLDLSFWPAFWLGILSAFSTIGLWLAFVSPKW